MTKTIKQLLLSFACLSVLAIAPACKDYKHKGKKHTEGKMHKKTKHHKTGRTEK